MNRVRIYYSSDAYTPEYSENKQSSFRSNITPQNLDYLPSDDPLEVALVNLTITLKETIADNEAKQLGVRSNLPKVSNIRGSGYDNIIYTFTILPTKTKLTHNYEIPTTQHIYLRTTRRNLEKATFQIIDLKENKVFTNIDNSTQATQIEVAVQPHTIMSPSNSMILSSDDVISAKRTNDNNTNMNFTTYLPERLEYQGQKWAVVCKGLQTTGKIYNVQDDTFTLTYTKMLQYEEEDAQQLAKKISVSPSQTVSYTHQWLAPVGAVAPSFGESVTVPAGDYVNIEHLVQVLNESLVGGRMEWLEFRPNDGKMLLKSAWLTSKQTGEKMEDGLLEGGTIGLEKKATLTITPELSRILGYSSSNSTQGFEFNILTGGTTLQSAYPYQVVEEEGEQQMDTSSYEETTMILPQGYYRTRLDVLTALNNQLEEETQAAARFHIAPSVGGLQQFSGPSTVKTKIISNGSTAAESFTLSPKLAKMLGFTNVLREEGYFVPLGKLSRSIVAAHYEDLHVGLPSNLIVNMDVVQTQAVGNKHLPVLQTIYIDRNRTAPAICHFVFRENNQVLLNTKLFSKVKITITDMNGSPVKAVGDYPTIVHLTFTRLG